MKKLIIFSIALLPLATFAAGKTEKSKKVDIHITVDKKGKVEVTGLNKDLKNLEKEINEALKDVKVDIEDGKQKHELHFKAELKIK